MKVELKDISKAFGANKVLQGVNLTVESGEVHALIGENGAGKSTLMNIFTGLLSSDGGKVLVDGQEVHYRGRLMLNSMGSALCIRK